jgi:hypothetical protein
MLYIFSNEHRIIGDANDGIVLVNDIQPDNLVGIQYDFSSGKPVYVDQDYNTVVTIIREYNYRVDAIYIDSYPTWEGWGEYQDRIHLSPYYFLFETKSFSRATRFNYGDKHKFIAMMNMRRPNRELVSAWLQHYTKKNPVSFFYTQSWEHPRDSSRLVEFTEYDYLSTHLAPKWIPYKNLNPRDYLGLQGLENVDVWNNVLGEHFSQSTFSIITEPIFWEKGSTLTEKYLMSIYGHCFPIFCGGYKIAQVAESLGFDVFSDVVDHSYQTNLHPTYRVLDALKLNQHLFSTGISKHNYYERHEKNIDVAKQLIKQGRSNYKINEINACYNLLSQSKKKI